MRKRLCLLRPANVLSTKKSPFDFMVGRLFDPRSKAQQLDNKEMRKRLCLLLTANVLSLTKPLFGFMSRRLFDPRGKGLQLDNTQMWKASFQGIQSKNATSCRNDCMTRIVRAPDRLTPATRQ